MGGDSHSATVGALERQLQNGEEALGARDTWRGEPKFTQQLLPFVEGASLLADEQVKLFEETCCPMLGDGDSLGDGVEEPPQNSFDGGPRTIALAQFFDRERLLSLWVLGRRAKELVDGVQE